MQNYISHALSYSNMNWNFRVCKTFFQNLRLCRGVSQGMLTVTIAIIIIAMIMNKNVFMLSCSTIFSISIA